MAVAALLGSTCLAQKLYVYFLLMSRGKRISMEPYWAVLVVDLAKAKEPAPLWATDETEPVMPLYWRWIQGLEVPASKSPLLMRLGEMDFVAVEVAAVETVE